MSQPAKVQEPSMEEILASIRRIIADDEAKPPVADKPASPPVAAKPAAAAPATAAAPAAGAGAGGADGALPSTATACEAAVSVLYSMSIALTSALSKCFGRVAPM